MQEGSAKGVAIISGLIAVGCVILMMGFIGMHSGTYYKKHEIQKAFQERDQMILGLGRNDELILKRLDAIEKKKR